MGANTWWFGQQAGQSNQEHIHFLPVQSFYYWGVTGLTGYTKKGIKDHGVHLYLVVISMKFTNQVITICSVFSVSNSVRRSSSWTPAGLHSSGEKCHKKTDVKH